MHNTSGSECCPSGEAQEGPSESRQLDHLYYFISIRWFLVLGSRRTSATSCLSLSAILASRESVLSAPQDKDHEHNTVER